ncbi:hypothetical protein C8F04DRAFT_1312403 [Mycena alexandri]|uniref:Uncharacterized protein n=1 Tax=Mycena alexandri TaxID=1745969 RepID=A0AAD6X5Z9_9AGAR|nr:hypothetical protein C8F04DRAFT_1312403 [Mycena alexandri]
MASTLVHPQPPAPTAIGINAILKLCIPGSSLGLYPPPPPNITSDVHVTQMMSVQPTAANAPLVYLIAGEISEIRLYSRLEETKWLLDIAHDLCDPLAMRGTLVQWDSNARIWRSTLPTDVLVAAIYCYVLPAGTVVGITKISERSGKSKTSGMGPTAGTMRTRVITRDKQCWPYRAKMNGATASVFDTIFGIASSAAIASSFDTYGHGFRMTTAGHYEVHTFLPALDDPTLRYTALGIYHMNTPFALLHGHPASPPHPQAPDLPPPGLFRWHYIQCVTGKFGHTDYKNLEHIVYSVASDIVFEGESEEGSTDSEADWPTAAWDRGRAHRDDMVHEEEVHDSVAKWIASV